MYTTVGHYYWFMLRPVVSHANFKLPIPLFPEFAFQYTKKYFFLILNTSTFTFRYKTPPVKLIYFHFLRKTLIIQLVFKLFKADDVTARWRKGRTETRVWNDILNIHFSFLANKLKNCFFLHYICIMSNCKTCSFIFKHKQSLVGDPNGILGKNSSFL